MTYEQIEKEFDEKYPPFTGVGASFPMFKDTPNRNHIKSFLKQSFIKYLQSEVERKKGMIKPLIKKPTPEEKLIHSIWGNGFITPQETTAYNQAISDQITNLQAQIKELEV